MRICPKCGKEYDDSWGVCLQCNEPLLEKKNPNALPDDIKLELDTVRRDIGALHERINPIHIEFSDILQQSGKLHERLNRIEKKVGAAYAVTRQSVTDDKAKASPDEPIRPAQEGLKKIISPIPNEPVNERRETFKTPYRHEETHETFEQKLGGSWFHKLGILAVVIGVALLIGYSFQYLGPVGKIAIGYAFGVVLIASGHVIERRKGFSSYGKGLIGGGWAITYFTTFAMQGIPAVKLISNPWLGFALLLVNAFLTISDIYRYKSEKATAFSYLLVFITLMLYPATVMTFLALIPITLSITILMLRTGWSGFGLWGMVLTYLSYMGGFGIVSQTRHTVMNETEFFLACSFLFIYWLIFTVSILFIRKSEKDPMLFEVSPGVAIGSQEVIFMFNTLLASVNAWLLLDSGFMRYMQPALGIISSLYLILTIWLFLAKKERLYKISSTVAIGFFMVFLAMKYTGYGLTLSYILLAQALLLAGITLKEAYWRLFSFGMLIAVLCKLTVIDSFFVKNNMIGPDVSARALLFAFAFAIYLINHILYKKLTSRNALCKHEAGHTTFYSYVFPLVYAMGTWLDLPKVLTAPCWVILGAILLWFGVSKQSVHQRIQGYILVFGAFLRLLLSNMLIPGGVGVISYRLMTCIPVLLVLYYCMLLTRDKSAVDTIGAGESRFIDVFPWMIFSGIMILVWFEVPKNFVAPVWGFIALGYAFLSVFNRGYDYLQVSTVAAIAAVSRAVFVNLFQGKYLVGAEGNIMYSLLTAAMLYGGNFVYIASRVKAGKDRDYEEDALTRFLHSSKQVYSICAALLVTVILATKFTGVMLTVSLGIEGIALFVIGFALKQKDWRIMGMLVLLGTLVKVFLVDLRQLNTIYYIISLIVLGTALLFVSYMYTKHKDLLKKFM